VSRVVFPKILITTPIYDGKDYCLRDFIDNARQIQRSTPNSHLLLVDNSATDSYVRKCRRQYRDISFAHVNRGRNSRDAICNSMNYARHHAIRYNYDYIMVLEEDLFPPKNVALLLYRHAKPVVGATYFISSMINGKLVSAPCIFTNSVDEKTRQGGTRLINAKEWNTIISKPGLHRVHGMGLGCTLIDKEIFARFPFWNSRVHDGKHHDVYFYMDLNNNNIPVYVDTSLVVEHRPSDWKDVKDK
jgi:hypothetical protein